MHFEGKEDDLDKGEKAIILDNRNNLLHSHHYFAGEKYISDQHNVGGHRIVKVQCNPPLCNNFVADSS